MLLETADRALERARHDHAHAIRALFNAETVAAQRRHARRAKVASSRIRDAMRDRARLACDLEAMREWRA